MASLRKDSEMQRSIAQIDGSSVRPVKAVFASRRLRRQPSLQAAEAYLELKSAPYQEKDESTIVTIVGERDQWDLLSETASVNVEPLIFAEARPIESFAIQRPYQLGLQYSFGWPGKLYRPNIFDCSFDQISVGLFAIIRQRSPYRFLFNTAALECPWQAPIPQRVALEEIYQIEDSEAVAEFLAQNTFLYDLLVEAHDQIVEFFGEGADVHLEVCDDPDSGGDRQLYAVIVTSLAAKDAIPLQEHLDDAWWLDNLMRARGKFNIIVEYV
jgi:hypothetical protein